MFSTYIFKYCNLALILLLCIELSQLTSSSIIIDDDGEFDVEDANLAVDLIAENNVVVLHHKTNSSVVHSIIFDSDKHIKEENEDPNTLEDYESSIHASFEDESSRRKEELINVNSKPCHSHGIYSHNQKKEIECVCYAGYTGPDCFVEDPENVTSFDVVERSLFSNNSLSHDVNLKRNYRKYKLLQPYIKEHAKLEKYYESENILFGYNNGYENGGYDNGYNNVSPTLAVKTTAAPTSTIKSNVCSSNGKYITVSSQGDVACHCDNGFVGPDCSQVCPGSSEMKNENGSVSVCTNGQGTCVFDGVSLGSKCLCFNDFKGLACDTCLLACDAEQGVPSTDCNSCICKNNWTGKHCNICAYDPIKSDKLTKKCKATEIKTILDEKTCKSSRNHSFVDGKCMLIHGVPDEKCEKCECNVSTDNNKWWSGNTCETCELSKLCKNKSTPSTVCEECRCPIFDTLDACDNNQRDSQGDCPCKKANETGECIKVYWGSTLCDKCLLTCSKNSKGEYVGTPNTNCTKCNCIHQYYGQTCEKCRLKEQNLCKNNSEADEACHQCNCKNKWSGSYCDSCSLVCINGGSNADCTACSCTENWSGNQCDSCNLEKNYCVHGYINDKCVKCVCPGGWEGNKCDACKLQCSEGKTPNDLCNACEKNQSNVDNAVDLSTSDEGDPTSYISYPSISEKQEHKDLTISFKIKLKKYGNGNPVPIRCDNETTNGHFSLYLLGKHLKFVLFGSQAEENSDSPGILFSNYSFLLNKGYDIALTYHMFNELSKTETAKIMVYVNGNLIEEKNLFKAIPIKLGEGRLGSVLPTEHDMRFWQFFGYFDDYRVWNTTLTSKQIESLYRKDDIKKLDNGELVYINFNEFEYDTNGIATIFSQKNSDSNHSYSVKLYSNARLGPSFTAESN